MNQVPQQNLNSRMRSSHKIAGICLSAVLISSAQAFAVSENLLKAQEAFLEKDYALSMANIGRAFREKKLSKPEIKNLAGIYKQIQENSPADIDLGWKLPDSVERLRASVQYFDVDGEKTFRLVIAGTLKTGVLVKNFKLTKYPDIVAIDSQSQIGKFDQGVSQGTQYFNARVKIQSLPIASGTYLVDFELSTNEIVKGWFVVTDDLNATETPTFNGLNAGAEITTATPRFSWNEPSKSQMQSFEKRAVRFSISPMTDADSWGDSVWIFNDPTGKTNSVDLGSDSPTETPLAPLKTGNYVVSVNYIDARVAKPLKLGREYRVGRKIKFKISDPN